MIGRQSTRTAFGEKLFVTFDYPLSSALLTRHDSLVRRVSVTNHQYYRWVFQECEDRSCNVFAGLWLDIGERGKSSFKVNRLPFVIV